MKGIKLMLIGSILLNLILISIIYNDMADERDEKEFLIAKFVENQKKISHNFNSLYLELSNGKSNTLAIGSDKYRMILDTLKETDSLLQLNEELYLANLDKKILSPSMREINMEGLETIPILWDKLNKGEIKDELPSIEEYNILLRTFLDKLNKEHNFQNVRDPRKMTDILKMVSTEVLNDN